MISRFRYTFNYFKYLLFAKHKKGHGIHSPFMYNLITKVFNNKTVDNDLEKIFATHNKLIKSKELITYDEIGAGSRYKPSGRQAIGKVVKRSSVNKKYGKLLYDLICYFKSEDVLELGTSVGISTAYMAQQSKKIISIEGIKAKAEIAQKIATQLNQPTEFIIGDFDQVLESVLKSYEKLDFVFFDGNHRKESTLKYFKLCLEKVHNETIFVFDDIHWSVEMEEAWNEIKKNEKIKVSVDLFQMGLIFFKKELSYEHYVIKF